MPELPEVETVRRDLLPLLLGRKVIGLELLWQRTLDRPHTLAEAEALLVGQQIVGLRRRGKYLLASMQSGAVLAIHLRMSGRLCLAAANSPDPAHLRARLVLNDGTELRFVDIRKFGRLYVLPSAAELTVLLANLGPEPLGQDMTLTIFRERLAGRTIQIKALLLDQRFLAGLGNIYVDEALFRAGLHPLRSTANLAEAETQLLYESCRMALMVAINNRGTTFRSYRDGWGERGRHKELLLVYGRDDEPCYVCGNEIEKLRAAGRGTHICPFCQPMNPLAPKAIGERRRLIAALDASHEGVSGVAEDLEG